MEMHDHLEELGIAWLLNPEQAKLRRELPFIAAALDVCLNHVKADTLNHLEQKIKAARKPTQKEIHRSDQWAKHKARQRRGVTNPNHERRTGRFLPKKD